ncbi:MAG: MCE family protein [Ponticaulis sp.]|nr:MCE family protein [Ponticaulis sp.]
METRASYALIGVALLAGFAALAAFVLWLGKVQFDREFAEYNVVFEGAVNGLSEGGQVRYLGINVGEVIDLSLDPDDPEKVIAHIRIDANTPVRADSKAILDFAGLTGVTFIQIRPGSPQSALLPSRTGVNLPIIETERTPLEEIFQGGQDVLTTAQVTLNRLNSILDEENAESLKETLSNLQTITAAIAEDEQLLADAKTALEALAAAGEAIGGAADAFTNMSSDVSAGLDDIVDGAQALIDDARRAVGVAETAISTSQTGFDETRQALQEPTVATMEEIERLTEDLRSLIRRMDRIAREIEQHPDTLLRGQPRPYREN